MLKTKSHYAYQPFFCEENIWLLVNELLKEDNQLDVRVLFFINQNHAVRMCEQLALETDLAGCWDYHVVLCLSEKNVIVDFDSRLGFEVELGDYFRMSFPMEENLRIEDEVTVRSISGKDYLEFFWSDRSHMIDSDGQPLEPFPAWPAILGRSAPLRLLDLRDTAFRDRRITDHLIPQFLSVFGK